MNLLIVSGVSSHDIYIYNFAKWLKASIDVNIDVYELSHSDQQKNDYAYFQQVGSPNISSFFDKKYIRTILKPLYVNYQLRKWLKNKHYDIIHCHWLVPSLIVKNCLKTHCDKLFVTFWGGELDSLKLYGSHKIYLKNLDTFMKHVYGVINSKEFRKKFNSSFPNFDGRYLYAQFGSEPIKQLCQLMKYEQRKDSKKMLNIPQDRITVQIGYSGKQLHQHLDIINELAKKENIKNDIFILAPMTRNFNDEYVSRVESLLKTCGIPYLVLKGYLSDVEIARLRNATDVVFQYSLFDGFSRSIVEGLCAKSLLLYGDWLNYDQYLESCQLFAVKTSSIANGVDYLKKYIDNPAKFDKQIVLNNERVKDSFLWENCIKEWICAYNQ